MRAKLCVLGESLHVKCGAWVLSTPVTLDMGDLKDHSNKIWQAWVSQGLGC